MTTWVTPEGEKIEVGLPINFFELSWGNVMRELGRM
jgi:hypothetical protein